MFQCDFCFHKGDSHALVGTCKREPCAAKDWLQVVAMKAAQQSSPNDRVFQVAFWAWFAVSLDDRNKFHPAVRSLAGTYVWYNIRCATAEEATDRAQKAVDDANEHLRNFTDQWNVQEA